jgi:hypothetical protein
MCVFDDSAVLQPALSFEQVRSGLAALGWDEAVDGGQLDQALTMLGGWGLLEASQPGNPVHPGRLMHGSFFTCAVRLAEDQQRGAATISYVDLRASLAG